MSVKLLTKKKNVVFLYSFIPFRTRGAHPSTEIRVKTIDVLNGHACTS